jgi:hypothetical protein
MEKCHTKRLFLSVLDNGFVRQFPINSGGVDFEKCVGNDIVGITSSLREALAQTLVFSVSEELHDRYSGLTHMAVRQPPLSFVDVE